jgi:O-antigen/teichoic acid export membrane protein
MKRDGMRRNLFAGLISSVWSAGLGLAVVPLYLKYLGLEAYGLIGVFASVQAFFSLLDFGLAPAMNREVAQGVAGGNMRLARDLLHTLSLVYWLTAAAIAIFAALVSPFISTHWLQANHLSHETVRNALVLMGFGVACRWPVGLYLGTLIGAQRVAVSSVITIVMNGASSIGAVVILAWVSPRIEAFFLWQAAVGIAYALCMRTAAWRAIGREPQNSFSLPSLTRIWRFSAGFSAIALSGILLTQIDKVVLSKMLSLSDFGRYSLATMVVSGFYMLFITPTFNVIFPRFTALVVGGDTNGLEDFYRWGTRLFAMALFPIFMLLGVFAQDLLRVWTGNPDLGPYLATVMALLSASAALHSVMHFSFALQLAYGSIRLPLSINVILTAIATPLMVLLAWQYGIRGGAAAVLLLYVLYLFIGTWLTHRQILKSIGRAWLCRDVGVPLLISLAVGGSGRFLQEHAAYSNVQKAGLACVMLLTAWAISLAVAPRTTISHLLRIVQISRQGRLGQSG